MSVPLTNVFISLWRVSLGIMDFRIVVAWLSNKIDGRFVHFFRSRQVESVVHIRGDRWTMSL